MSVKAKKATARRRGGRQPLYQEDMHPRLVRWMMANAKTPPTVAEIARTLGVSRTTLHNWRKANAPFDEAFEEPVGMAVGRVEASLYQRSLGYEHRTLKVIREPNDQGEMVEVRREESARHVPPDAGSIQYFLNNRDPDRWKSKSSVEHSVEGSFAEQLDRAWKKAKAAAALDEAERDDAG